MQIIALPRILAASTLSVKLHHSLVEFWECLVAQTKKKVACFQSKQNEISLTLEMGVNCQQKKHFQYVNPVQ